MSGEVLRAIVDRSKARLRESRQRRPWASVARQAENADPPRRFVEALHETGRLNVIAEFKPASPTRGPIRPDADVGETARAYEASGAAAMSILTEPEFFGSELSRLTEARRACALPLLRKDFLTHPYQVDESRGAGADAVLVIVSILEGSALLDIVQAAVGRGMAPLVEVHDEAELDRALAVEAALIGINQRDLRDLSLDAGRAARILPRLPAGTTAVAESGLSKREELERLRDLGCHAFLIGTHLMEAEAPGQALAKLLK